MSDQSLQQLLITNFGLLPSGYTGSQGAIGFTGSVGAGAAGGGGPTIYSTVNELPVSDNSTGSLAYVSTTKQLYIWDGSAWDRVYTGTEQVPEVTTEPAASVIANFSSNSTIQHQVPFVASDPEGFPISYDHAYSEPVAGMVESVTYSNGNYNLTLNSTGSGKIGQTVVFRAAASDGLHVTSRTQRVFFAVSNPISLGGGTGGGPLTNTYTAPNGTVVTASQTTYNGPTYSLAFMFNNTVATNSSNADYWLGASGNDATITIDFRNSPVTYLHSIQIFPRARDDTFTSVVSVETTANPNDGFTPVPSTSIAVNSSYPFGGSSTFLLQTTNRVVRIVLLKSGSWGASLDEIKFTGV
jgi:hypothetical protein